MRIYSITGNLSLIDIEPAIPGFAGFIGTYVIRGKTIALIDVGPSSSFLNLLQALEALSIKPDEVGYILLTHIHIDHAGGVGTAVRHLPQAKVLVQELGKKHLINPERLWEGSKKALGELADKYGEIEPTPEERIAVVTEGNTIDLGEGMALRVLSTPGHARHHLSFLETKESRLFAGEAAGVYTGAVLRPSTPPPFDLDQALTSLDKLTGLEPASLCYGHFGCAEDAPGRLRSHKEQLKLWSETIAECWQGGAEIEEIYSEIAHNDEGLKRLENLPSEQYQRERYFVLNSIKGFMDYFSARG